MFDLRAVNALTESHRNAEPPVRTFEAVAKQLTDCQRCIDWGDGECTRHDRETWIEMLIRPGKSCELWY